MGRAGNATRKAGADLSRSESMGYLSYYLADFFHDKTFFIIRKVLKNSKNFKKDG